MSTDTLKPVEPELDALSVAMTANAFEPAVSRFEAVCWADA